MTSVSHADYDRLLLGSPLRRRPVCIVICVALLAALSLATLIHLGLLASMRLDVIVRPETLVRWHRAGFRRYWRWKSRSLGGRPQIGADLRALIRRMSDDNPLWGAPRIHGELLRLGFEVAQSSVAKYMVKRRGPPSPGWRTFLRSHAPDIAAMDLFIAPTIGFDLLYVLVIVQLERRKLVWINVTPHPTAEWIARQITEAFPWSEAPRYLIRDRGRVYGAALTITAGHPRQPSPARWLTASPKG